MPNTETAFIPVSTCGHGLVKRPRYSNAEVKQRRPVSEISLPRKQVSRISTSRCVLGKGLSTSSPVAKPIPFISTTTSLQTHASPPVRLRSVGSDSASSRYVEKVCADAVDESDYLPASTPWSRLPANSEASALDGTRTFWAGTISSALLALFGAGLCAFFDIPMLGKGWTFSPSLLGQAVLTVMPFQVVMYFISRQRGLQVDMEENFRAIFENRALWQVGVFCACVALGEEIFFRSWLLGILESWQWSPYFALVSSSVIFGVLHSYSRVYMVIATVAGMLFGGMFLSSGQSLLKPLLVHFLYDFFAILVLQRAWLASDKL